MINQTLQKKRGFSLIETLVAVSILMISIAGPMVLVGNGIRSSAFARDQVTAFYLAQDAVEAMRYIRDNNRIDIVVNEYPDWDVFDSYASCTNANPCGIDTYKVYNGISNPITQATADDTLQIDGDGVYGYFASSADDTKFTRYIEVVEVNNNEVEIIVTVNWSSGIFTKTFSVRENLFYWY